MQILIADHNQDNLKILSLKLESHGFDVVMAHDGRQAISLIRKHKPDMAILDVSMPKLNGFEVTRRVRSDAKLKKTPVILLTAQAREVDKIRGEKIGADLFMTKPYDPEKLLNEVRRLAGGEASLRGGV